MKNYIKDFPRGTDSEIEAIIKILPRYTQHLNDINGSLTFIRKLNKISVRENNERITNAIFDIEKQGAFNQFLTLRFLDLLVVYRNALSAIHIWEEIYSLRQGYLLIYESLKTYNSHSKSLKELSSKTSPRAETSFYLLADDLKEFKRNFKYDSVISEFRNKTIGHIESDPVSFFKRISEFDIEEAFAALEAFLSILKRMIKLSEDIFYNYTQNIIKQVSFDNYLIREFPNEINRLLNEIDDIK